MNIPTNSFFKAESESEAWVGLKEDEKKAIKSESGVRIKKKSATESWIGNTGENRNGRLMSETEDESNTITRLRILLKCM